MFYGKNQGASRSGKDAFLKYQFEVANSRRLTYNQNESDIFCFDSIAQSHFSFIPQGRGYGAGARPGLQIRCHRA